jgi:hypothetical protein
MGRKPLEPGPFFEDEVAGDFQHHHFGRPALRASFMEITQALKIHICDRPDIGHEQPGP